MLCPDDFCWKAGVSVRSPPRGAQRSSVYQRILQWVIVILLAVALLFIYFLGSQLRYESEGSRFFKEGRFDAAAEKYLKAYESTTFWGHDRYLYLVAQCYYNSQDWTRAMDFFIRLTKDYPGSNWVIVCQPSVEKSLRNLNPNLLSWEGIKAQTSLGRFRASLRQSYQRLVSAIAENKSGISVEVEGQYQIYCKQYQLYRQELAKAYAEVAAGKHPESLDPSPAPGSASAGEVMTNERDL